ncbi:hypothetical protein COCCADRAFT_83758 [Bipolaris zeicola 26-R-13]|uniref:Uncharacterized protein n=1 Tax=Cochliobolus carbonum (strain 26-R-13) TaxID=930089 RepID=W6Z3F2_COCC2|nr:uncharacterized protein COCCADRAFT_83758 [Bipolaris zeicola 26-R-13]EUC38196.1 hypothetical protein COCCADRAFT_83758 [Bipolaris zeicola 26-R-13]
MNALDFLVEFVHLEGTSDHLLPQHNQTTNPSKHPICNKGAEMMPSAHSIAYEQYHFTQKASEPETTYNFPTNLFPKQHMFSVSTSHLPDPSIINFEYHDIPQPSIEHDDHTSQTLTGYPQREQGDESSHETTSVIPQAYYQQSNNHAPWTPGYEASKTHTTVPDMRYDAQTPYIFQPTQQQEIHYVSFSEGTSPVQIHCNNTTCGCWAQKPQSYHPTENTWPPWNITQVPYGCEVPPIYNDWTLESTRRCNFSTV